MHSGGKKEIENKIPYGDGGHWGRCADDALWCVVAAERHGNLLPPLELPRGVLHHLPLEELQLLVSPLIGIFLALLLIAVRDRRSLPQRLPRCRLDGSCGVGFCRRSRWGAGSRSGTCS
jgi:hypothetical protein